VKSNGVGCELCSLILSAAKYMRSNGKTDVSRPWFINSNRYCSNKWLEFLKEEIVSLIKREQCNRLGSLREACEKYIDIESPKILDDLTKGNIVSF
jgi:hypothetical protein